MYEVLYICKYSSCKNCEFRFLHIFNVCKKMIRKGVNMSK